MKKLRLTIVFIFLPSIISASNIESMRNLEISDIKVENIKQTEVNVPEVKLPIIDTTGRQANTEEQIANLAAILKGKGVIQMPPVGIQHFANELNVNVELASCSGEAGFRQLTETKIQEVLNLWKDIGYRNATSLVGLQQDGVQVLYLAEVNGENNNITDYLINSIVRKQDRARVKALLNDPDFAADFVRVQTYEVSSEIIGREIILIKPWNARKALVIELDYVQS